MKKEYIKPTADVMELNYTGMLCSSIDKIDDPDDDNFETLDEEEDEIPVKDKGTWDQSVL